MASTSVRACLRCHEKKIKCTGYPSCRNCTQTQVRCEAYTRPRKSDSARAVREAQRRIRWLEDELSRELAIDCRSIPTDTPLRFNVPRHTGSAVSRCSEPRTPQCQHDSISGSGNDPSGFATASRRDSPSRRNKDDAPEISLLALNATGDLRYLGPSSGALFANYAISLLRSIAPPPNTIKSRFDQGRNGRETPAVGVDSERQPYKPLSPDEIRLLLQSYRMWVHPLYPLLDIEVLDNLVARCTELQATSSPHQSEGQEMSIFYLVMALGAINHANTAKQLNLDPSQTRLSDTAASPTYLYSAASKYFLNSDEQLRPSIVFIQIILLVCIYSSYGPIGSSQWQLAGLAMRTAVEIGLHYSPKDRQTSSKDLDERNRVFWTAYAIEITLAYNLGRPPSISLEHIAAQLPVINSPDIALGVHYIKHRQIQSRIVAQVYYGSCREEGGVSPNQRQSLIAKLQSDLDEWRIASKDVCPKEPGAPYPLSYWDRLYHGTTFVLHRASPLCPHPSDESLERCIRSAGAYIDDMADILRASNVPLSWMLVQGILFAGLTMLVSVRTNYHRLASRTGLPFLLVELPAWSRKCSVCLAVVNERWGEKELLPELGNQFELLADDTLGAISTELTSQIATNRGYPRAQPNSMVGNGLVANTAAATGQHSSGFTPGLGEQELMTSLDTNNSRFGDFGMPTTSWENLDLFRDVLGIDDSQTFWDIFAPETDSNGHGQRNLFG